MEDRYLYKAKTTPKEKGEFNNVWVTGNLIVSNGKYYIHPVGNVVNVKNELGRIIVMHEVIPDTICRCTGLKDKNGKLIWENDILLQKTTEKHWCKWQLMGLVKYGEHDWNEGVYGYKNIGFFVEPIVKEGDEIRMNPGLCQEDLVFENYPYEVIGNIFDNPELLQ